MYVFQSPLILDNPSLQSSLLFAFNHSLAATGLGCPTPTLVTKRKLILPAIIAAPRTRPPSEQFLSAVTLISALISFGTLGGPNNPMRGHAPTTRCDAQGPLGTATTSELQHKHTTSNNFQTLRNMDSLHIAIKKKSPGVISRGEECKGIHKDGAIKASFDHYHISRTF